MASKPDPGFKRLQVIGLGYVGLPTAAIFASRGLDVLGVDTDEGVVELINQGRIHIVEPDLDHLVSDAVAAGRLRAQTQPEPADAFIIAVPTPLTAERKPDLSHLQAAAESLRGVLKKGDLIVVESTVPVGATESLSARLSDLCPGLSFPNEAGADNVLCQGALEVTYCACDEQVGNTRIFKGLCIDSAGCLNIKQIRARTRQHDNQDQRQTLPNSPCESSSWLLLSSILHCYLSEIDVRRTGCEFRHEVSPS